MESFAWSRYTKKMHDLLRRPLSIGQFTSTPENMSLCSYEGGSKDEGNWYRLQILVDLTDGVIADVKYSFFGPTVLLVSLEAIARYIVRKNIRQALKVSVEVLDRTLRDQDAQPAFKERHGPYVLFAVDGISQALEKVSHIEVKDYSTPLEEPPVFTGERMGENWLNLSDESRIKILEQAFEEHIRPFLAIDEGGVQILGIENHTEIKIAYSGNCTSCFSAIGSTLNGIQSLLQERVYSELKVIPDLDNLNLHHDVHH